MALTKAVEAVDAWQEIAQDTVTEGTIVDLTSNYDSILHIDLAITTETAHTGTEILVQVSSAAADDEFWSTLKSFVSLIGTANSESITNDPLNAGEGDAPDPITVASTTGYATNGTWLFLEDATIANSELVYQVDFVTDTSITVLNGVKRTHQNTADLYNLAIPHRPIQLPMSANRVRVVYNNTFDPDGSTVAIRSRLAKVTAIV
jgi:hypothetical protein